MTPCKILRHLCEAVARRIQHDHFATRGHCINQGLIIFYARIDKYNDFMPLAVVVDAFGVLAQLAQPRFGLCRRCVVRSSGAVSVDVVSCAEVSAA